MTPWANRDNEAVLCPPRDNQANPDPATPPWANCDQLGRATSPLEQSEYRGLGTPPWAYLDSPKTSLPNRNPRESATPKGYATALGPIGTPGPHQAPLRQWDSRSRATPL